MPVFRVRVKTGQLDSASVAGQNLSHEGSSHMRTTVRAAVIGCMNTVIGDPNVAKRQTRLQATALFNAEGKRMRA